MNYWKEKPVLITGGAGFIGHRLVAKLIENQADITVIDDLSKSSMQNIAPYLDQVRLVNADLRLPAVAERAVSECEICFHLAAKIGGIGYFHKTPATSLRDNSIMNLNLWDAAVGADTKMVCLSSSMVFERTSTFPTPESAIVTSPPPITGYGFSKLVSEYIARTYYEEFGVEYIIARPFNAYGEGETPGEYIGYAHVIPDLIKKVLEGQYPLEILGSGKQTRCFTYVDDIVDALLFVTEAAKNDDFNISTNIETSIIELAEKIWRLCERKRPLKLKHLAGFKYDVPKRVPDTSKITRLGWQPKTRLGDGLRRTIEWIRGSEDKCREVSEKSLRD